MSCESVVRLEEAHIGHNEERDFGFLERTNTTGSSYQVRPVVNSTTSTPDVIQLVNQGPSTGLEAIPDQQSITEQNVMTSRNPKKNLWRIIAVCIWTGTAGASDAAPGALLPHIESFYGISYTVVSLIWMANAAGFILVACLSSKIEPYLGKKYSLTLGCVLSCIMYSLVSSGTLFPLIVLGFFFGGAGIAIVLAQSNIFLASLDKQSKYLSFSHGSYGIGATLAPLLSTVMVNSGIRWHYFYLIILAIMVLNTINLYMSFSGADEDLKPFENDQSSVTTSSEMLVALKHPITWIISFFCLFYQGSEVSVGGWVVTYLIDYRHANAGSVGYVASGFWGGLTIGRLLLTRMLHLKIGARRSVSILSVCCIIFGVLVWVVPNVFAEGVFVAFLGVLIGPSYSLLITVSSILLPRKHQVVSLTIMTAFGSSGGAIFPFLVGLISQKSGTYVVMPVFIALYSSMLCLWLILPNYEKQRKVGGAKLGFFERLW